MLVLVNDFCRRFSVPALKNLTACLSITLVLPAICFAQNANEDPFGEHSILERSNDIQTAAANGSVSISSPAQDPFTASPLPQAPAFPDDPVPPNGMIVPATPTPSTFTQQSDISMNGLRSEVVSGSDPSRAGAQGTFATTNQSMQSPPITSGGTSQFKGGTGFTPPARSFGSTPEPQKSFQAPVVSSFGDTGGTTQRLSDTSNLSSASRSALPQSPTLIGSRPRTSGLRSGSNPAFGSGSANTSNSSRSNSQTSSLTPRPRTSGLLRDPNQSTGSGSPRVASAPVTQFSSPVAGNQNSGQSFNTNANSNYNRGINQNIASGSPSIQSRNQNGISNRIQSRNLTGNRAATFQRDSSVRPSGYAQPVAAASPRKLQTGLAKNLISRYSANGMDPSQLPGRPVKLVELLKQPIATDQRRPLVHQFWETYFDWASLVNSQQYLKLLDSLPAPVNAAEQSILQTAKSMARNDVLASEIQLVKSQSKLNQFIPNRQPNQPFLVPNETPLIQGYGYNTSQAVNSNNGQNTATQAMPTNLVGINKMLPKTLELILQRADTVESAQQANQRMVSGLRSRQVSLGDTLTAAKQLRAVEQSLLVAVTDYNHATTDYFFTIAQSYGYIPPEQVVSNLLGASKSNNTQPTTPQPDVVAQRFRNARIANGSNSGVPTQRTQGQPIVQGNFGQNNQVNAIGQGRVGQGRVGQGQVGQGRNGQTTQFGQSGRIAQPSFNQQTGSQFGIPTGRATGNTASGTGFAVSGETSPGNSVTAQSNSASVSRNIPVGRVTPLRAEQSSFSQPTQQPTQQTVQQPTRQPVRQAHASQNSSGNAGQFRRGGGQPNGGGGRRQFGLDSTQGSFKLNPTGNQRTPVSSSVPPVVPGNQGRPVTPGPVTVPGSSSAPGVFAPQNTNPATPDRSASAPFRTIGR